MTYTIKLDEASWALLIDILREYNEKSMKKILRTPFKKRRQKLVDKSIILCRLSFALLDAYDNAVDTKKENE